MTRMSVDAGLLEIALKRMSKLPDPFFNSLATKLANDQRSDDARDMTTQELEIAIDLLTAEKANR